MRSNFKYECVNMVKDSKHVTVVVLKDEIAGLVLREGFHIKRNTGNKNMKNCTNTCSNDNLKRLRDRLLCIKMRYDNSFHIESKLHS